MLKEYPNLNLRNKDGLQAIHAYSQYGDVFTLKMLLAYGANINAEVISESDP
jgi:ankyrin repeat protein